MSNVREIWDVPTYFLIGFAKTPSLCRSALCSRREGFLCRHKLPVRIETTATVNRQRGAVTASRTSMGKSAAVRPTSRPLIRSSTRKSFGSAASEGVVVKNGNGLVIAVEITQRSVRPRARGAGRRRARYAGRGQRAVTAAGLVAEMG